MEEKSKCIYCLQEKPKTDEFFNKEHVIARMLGTYNDAKTLHNFEVCKCCNKAFRDQFEDEIAIDSYESYLRAQYTDRFKDNKEQICNKRLSITVKSGIFKGIRLTVSVDQSVPGKIQYKAEPAVGIIKDISLNEYDYYDLTEIPECSNEIWNRMKQSKDPIIAYGYEAEDIYNAFISKGYKLSKDKIVDNLTFTDVTDTNNSLIELEKRIDSIVIRLAAKNLFNYLCFVYGKEYVLDKKFDALRTFIRYGKIIDKIKMCIIGDGLINIPGAVDGGNVVGTILASENSSDLYGFVSWFGKITYCFLIDTYQKIHDETKTKYFIIDNNKRELTVGKSQLFFL